MAFKVLHLVDSNQRRGAEMFAVQLADNLSADRFISAFCIIDSIPGPGLPLHGIRTFMLGGSDQRRGVWKTAEMSKVWNLRRVLAEFQPDIILAHGAGTLKYAALSQLCRKRSATIYRNIGTASFWANSIAKVRLNKLLLKRIDAVVSVSQYSRHDFIRLYRFPPECVVYVPNGVDITAFVSSDRALARRQVRQELGLPQTDAVLVNVGSLSPEKGHATLLRLMADLPRTRLESHLILVGDGPLRGMLEQQAKELNIADHVHFLGTRGDVPRLLAAADLFILPSKTEGMPGCLIEAGLAGLASVSFDVGGVAEVVEHQVTGLVVPPEDFQGLLQAVVSLWQDQQRRTAMGTAARQRCQHLFDIRNVAREYEELFMRLLTGSRSPARRHRDHLTETPA